MTLRKLARLGWQGLVLHKLRSLLSALGIVFGVAAVVSMLSVGEGARREILAEVGRLGVSRITVRAAELSGDVRRQAGTRQSSGLTLGDARAIAEVCPDLVGLAPIRERAADLFAGERRTHAFVVATTPSYGRAEDLGLARGRFLSDPDVAQGQRVVVLGHELAQVLFPYDEPLGRRVRIDDEWFAVVGALEPRARSKRGSMLQGRDVNRTALVPITCLPRAADRVDEIAVRMADADTVGEAARLIEALMMRRHRGVPDFELVVPKELLAGYERARFQFNVVVGSIAAISLLVGGIGIMNIMLANVAERTREVGIRRSLGATRADIVAQFLTEAVLLTGVGGACGLFLGILASFLVSAYAGWATAIAWWSPAAAVALATVTGLGFGLYPAWLAAGKSPMDSLRYE